MKIAICDDCREDIGYLKDLIKKSERCPEDAMFFEFTSGEELLESYQDFDIVFLDMMMKGMDGSETAENIRKRDTEVILSFYSEFEMAAHKILNSRPSGYLMKDSGEEKLSLDIDAVFTEMHNKKQNKQIEIQYYGTVIRLKMSDILYISINKKGSLIWITDRKAAELWKPDERPKEQALKSGINLAAYYKDLKDYGFIYASKSYIVNVANIVIQQPECIVLNGGSKLSVTRGMRKTFEEEIGRFWNLDYNRRRSREP